MDIEGRDVAVVGAGIAGSVAAYLLAQRGARVTVLERRRDPAAGGAGLALAPNGLAVLYALGLRSTLRAVSTRVGSIPVRNQHGRLLMENRPPRVAGWPDHLLLIRRERLLGALRRLLSEHPGITLRDGGEVDAVSATGEVHLRDGSPLGITPWLVIGADGARSVTRGCLDLASSIRHGPTYVRGLVSPIEGAGFSEFWTHAGVFGVADVSGATYFYASVKDAMVRRAIEARDVVTLRERWKHAHPLASDVVGDVSRARLSVNEVVRVRCRTSHVGRVVLVGDAAHAMAPNAGQGGNSALVDAAVLVDVLLEAESLEAALRAYDRRRQRRVRRVQRLSGQLARLAESDGALWQAARERALPRVAAGRRRSAAQALRVFQERPDELFELTSRAAG